MTIDKNAVSRRRFVQASGISAAALAGTTIASPLNRAWTGGTRQTIKVGVIGCGGRGTGAAWNALEADDDVVISHFADLFPDQVEKARGTLKDEWGDRITATERDCFTGWDAFLRLCGQGCHYVILATPPHFRPKHIATAIGLGKHVFTEKPVAVDPVGIRTVFAAHAEADRRKLCTVAGTQRRHEQCYLEVMERIADGAIGRPVSGSCYWNMGELWHKEREPEWTDMEWQLRNWLYFTWLSGDHITEQHVHNLDVINWINGGPPVRAMGMGGRQARTDPRFGHIFDHFTVEYEYENGFVLNSMCRQTNGCANRVEERVRGTEGSVKTTSGFAEISGPNKWKFESRQISPYVQEHKDLIHAIRSGDRINELKTVAESTLTAIMGRMSAYTGKEVSLEFALNSKLDLTPPAYEFGPLETPAIPIPGKMELI
ncbi:MAG: Gfo/Idh/MocA family oxidoreductase [Planctomycetota bacterium]|nr:MAG: Gfo/Idh/MocA family oxidoreductase [Planctomycetota bacterium]